MQYSLSWKSYQNNICNGLSSLQQNGEFVDMTLAADGHLVKVHQMLIALASPYLKEIIQSAPCPHPVVFLNNISYATLCNLLEYIYTGETLVPAENIQMFFLAAKALHIKGLEEMNFADRPVPDLSSRKGLSQIDEELCPMSGVKRTGQLSEVHVQQIPHLRVSTVKDPIKHEVTFSTDIKKHFSDNLENDVADDTMDYDDIRPSSNEKETTKGLPAMNLQFTVSNRGSLQVILNRYMYNLHSTSRRSGVKRWRCVEYRNKRCQAFLVTNGNVVLNRANLHNHPFHDKKILTKIEKKAIYSTIDDVKGVREESKNIEDKDSDGEETDQQEYTRLESLIDDDKGTD